MLCYWLLLEPILDQPLVIWEFVHRGNSSILLLGFCSFEVNGDKLTGMAWQCLFVSFFLFFFYRKMFVCVQLNACVGVWFVGLRVLWETGSGGVGFGAIGSREKT